MNIKCCFYTVKWRVRSCWENTWAGSELGSVSKSSWWFRLLYLRLSQCNLLTLLSRHFMTLCWFVAITVCTVTTIVTATLLERRRSFSKITPRFCAVVSWSECVIGRWYSLISLSVRRKDCVWSLNQKLVKELSSVSLCYNPSCTSHIPKKPFIM